MSEETTPCCCHCRTKHRDDKEERDLLNRLSRIEGQIRGIRGMVEKDAYCPDILTQVAAASAALNSFSKVLLATSKPASRRISAPGRTRPSTSC